MFAGASYNLALISAVLLFWAFTKRRELAAAAIRAWRRRRAAQAPLPALSSHCGPAAPLPAAPQLTASPVVTGQGSGTGAGQGSGEASGQGPGQGSGEGTRRQVETLANGVTGMWIKVGQPGDDRA